MANRVEVRQHTCVWSALLGNELASRDATDDNSNSFLDAYIERVKADGDEVVSRGAGRYRSTGDTVNDEGCSRSPSVLV